MIKSNGRVSRAANYLETFVPQLEGPYISDLDFLGMVPISHFSPRDELQQIFAAFSQQPNRWAVCCAIGIGGAGKTQLALKYARDHFRTIYSTIFWIDASSHHNLSHSFIRIARMLKIYEPLRFHGHGESNAVQTRWDADHVSAVKNWLLRQNGRWLLVFDNADDLNIIDSLHRYFATPPQGNIIVTSRRDEADRLSEIVVRVGGLSPESASALLLHRADIKNASEPQQNLALQVVGELGCLALAVDLAGSYVRKFHGDLKSYLKEYKKAKEQVLRKAIGSDRRNASGSSYPWSVFAAWGISIASMTTTAARLISLLSFLDRTNITLEFFARCCQTRSRYGRDGNLIWVSPKQGGVPAWFTKHFGVDGKWDGTKFRETVAELCSYSFATCELVSGPISYVYEDKTVYDLEAEDSRNMILLHPLVHEVARLWLPDSEYRVVQRDVECMVWHSIDDDAHKVVRTPNTEYVPVILLGGGASTNPVRVALHLDEAYRHVHPHALVEFFQQSTNEAGAHLRGSKYGYRMDIDFPTGIPIPGDLQGLYFNFVVLFLLRFHQVNNVSDLTSRYINWHFFVAELQRLQALRRKELTLQWLRLSARVSNSELNTTHGIDNAISYAAAKELFLFQEKLKMEKLSKNDSESSKVSDTPDTAVSPVTGDSSSDNITFGRQSDLRRNVTLGFVSLNIPTELIDVQEVAINRLY
jgi:hypothetical protein